MWADFFYRVETFLQVSCRELNKLHRTFKLLIEIWIMSWFRDFWLHKGHYAKRKNEFSVTQLLNSVKSL